MIRIAVAGLFLVLACGALAQPVAQVPAAPLRLDSVIVTGVRDAPETVINNFVKSNTVRTATIEKVPRWRARICPKVQGLAPKYAEFITQRLRAIAKQVGAPVDPAAACRSNITIVFTTQPQALLDNVRKAMPMYLGYYDNMAQADALAQVKRPIQAWYTTQSRDHNGQTILDSRNAGGEVEVPVPCGFDGCDPSWTIRIPKAKAFASTGTRLGDGLSSEFFHVLVVVEPARLVGHEIGTLADYIAMVSLSQLAAPDSCQDLASIINLLSPGCAQMVAGITDADIAFLTGLYRMNATAIANGQRGEVAYQMRKALLEK